LPSFLASAGVLAAPLGPLAGAGVAALPGVLAAGASFLTGTGVAALDFCCLAAGVVDAGAGRFFESACLGGGACGESCQK
jgi:hypothetical protein